MKGLAGKTSEKTEVLNQISSIREELTERFTVKRIGIFGSFARGEEKAESDIDIIVELGLTYRNLPKPTVPASHNPACNPRYNRCILSDL